tara:strand:+ start:3224 stop:3484 length:261 start_codon:yes stop_codon:yes gene_type:complete
MDEQGKKVSKVFIWSFVVSESIFILFAISTQFFKFLGIVVGITMVTSLSLFIAIVLAVGYGAARRGAQIGDIIEARHKEVKSKEKK